MGNGFKLKEDKQQKIEKVLKKDWGVGKKVRKRVLKKGGKNNKQEKARVKKQWEMEKKKKVKLLFHNSYPFIWNIPYFSKFENKRQNLKEVISCNFASILPSNVNHIFDW